MASATAELNRLADFDMWEDVIILFVGFIVPTLLKNTVEGRDIINLPDEVYGLVVIVGAGMLTSGSTRKFAAAGGGLYSVDALAQRLNIKTTLEEMGA